MSNLLNLVLQGKTITKVTKERNTTFLHFTGGRVEVRYCTIHFGEDPDENR